MLFRSLTAVDLEHFEGLLNQIAQVGSLSLRVVNTLYEVNLVTEVLVADLEEVEYGEDLSVVGDESLTNGV